MEKLKLVNGIIQNKSIMGIPVYVKIIEPYGNKNVRTLIPFENIPDQCHHDTGNSSPTADDSMHANWLQNVENADFKYVSPHVFIDEDSITQCIPLNEVGYHAGTKHGNLTSFGIEKCINGDIAKADYNAQVFGACYLTTFPETGVYKHEDYSGKYCPRTILDRDGWEQYRNEIIEMALECWECRIKNSPNISEPDGWIETINTLVDIANLSGDTGLLERAKFLPDFIEKLK